MLTKIDKLPPSRSYEKPILKKKESKEKSAGEVLEEQIREARVTSAKMFLKVIENIDLILEQFPAGEYKTSLHSSTFEELENGMDISNIIRMYVGLENVLSGREFIDRILEFTDKNRITKTTESIREKLELKNIEEIKDFFRFTIYSNKDYQSEDEIFEEFTKIVELLAPFGYIVSDPEAKIKAGGYTDMTIIFERFGSDGKKTYIEVQVNNIKAEQVKEEEKKFYKIKCSISNKLYQLTDLDPDMLSGKLFERCLEVKFRRELKNDFDSHKDFKITDSEWIKFNFAMNSLISKDNVNVFKIAKYWSVYGDAFAKGFELFASTNPLIKTTNDAKRLNLKLKNYMDNLV